MRIAQITAIAVATLLIQVYGFPQPVVSNETVGEFNYQDIALLGKRFDIPDPNKVNGTRRFKGDGQCKAWVDWDFLWGHNSGSFKLDLLALRFTDASGAIIYDYDTANGNNRRQSCGEKEEDACKWVVDLGFEEKDAWPARVLTVRPYRPETGDKNFAIRHLIMNWKGHQWITDNPSDSGNPQRTPFVPESGGLPGLQCTTDRTDIDQDEWLDKLNTPVVKVILGFFVSFFQ